MPKHVWLKEFWIRDCWSVLCEIWSPVGSEVEVVAFWDVMQCSLVDMHQCFSVVLKVETVHSSEMLVSTKLLGVVSQKAVTLMHHYYLYHHRCDNLHCCVLL